MKAILLLVLIDYMTLLRLKDISSVSTPNISHPNLQYKCTSLIGGNMSSLVLTGGETDDIEFKFGSLNNFYSFALRGKFQDFVFSNVKRPIFSINKNSDVILFSNKLNPQKGLVYTGDFKIRGVNQWKLVIEEDFSQIQEGWSNKTVTNCSGIYMLGGYCEFSGGETVKTFTDIPEHQYLRIQATYHFIDAWDSESGYLKINNGKESVMEYAWIERYSAFQGSNGVNVCGGRWPEGKFSSPIDIVIPHKNNTIDIAFGSTLEQDPCDQSFGVSGVKIYIR